MREPDSSGAWEIVSPVRAAELLSSVRVPWWVAGGWALDLFLGADTRPHQDLDIGILRRDLPEVRRVLHTWDVFVAKDGAALTVLAAAAAIINSQSGWAKGDSCLPL